MLPQLCRVWESPWFVGCVFFFNLYFVLKYCGFGRKPRVTKEPLAESERGESKSWLKCNIQKTKIMASGPITSWQMDRETVETVSDFILGGSKITADGYCSHEIKRSLLLGRKAVVNLDSILKSRDITLLTNVCLVKAMVFPVVRYGWESWTIKKAECQRMLKLPHNCTHLTR